MALMLSNPGLVLFQVVALLSWAVLGGADPRPEQHVAPGKCHTFPAFQTFDQSQFLGSWFVWYQYSPPKFRQCQNFNFTSTCDQTMTIEEGGTTDDCDTRGHRGRSYASNPEAPGAMTWHWDRLGALTDHVTVVDTDYENYAVLIICNDLDLIHLNYALLLTRQENVPDNETSLAIALVHKVIDPFLSLREPPPGDHHCGSPCPATSGGAAGHQDRVSNGHQVLGHEFSEPESVQTVVDHSRHGKRITVSTTWRTGDADEDSAPLLIKDMQGRMEKLEEDMLQMKETNARLRCSPAAGMTRTQWGCFKAFNDLNMTWVDAKDHCAALGLELASLGAASSIEQLLQLEKSVGLLEAAYYWVGLSRNPAGDGEWRWLSGARLDAESPLWYSSQPHNGDTDDAGFLGTGKGLGDYKSSDKYPVLCAVP